MLNDYILEKTMQHNMRDQRQQADQANLVRRALQMTAGPARRPSLLAWLGITIKVVVRRANA
jgi:hypothetical protein